MRPLPSGTVTLLFTDIEGSTRLVDELGERYAEVVAEHRRVLRGAFSRHGGIEVDTQGDAFFVAFARSSDAVLAADEAQDALADGPVRVRIGIHTGEPVVTEEGYVGIDVHRAARIMGAGHGGQVLLSEATARLLDSRIELRDLGEHRLKDLSAPQRLYQLGHDSFPRPRTLYRTNLPIQRTALVGRRRELQEAGTLLRTHRLLTLTGPGGSGKTRLALQLASEAVECFPDGVFWVPLQALGDPALVEPAIATSLDARDRLIEHVANKRLLVLLDNFEHVAEAAPIVSSLLAGTPNTTVLVTSREPLHIESEQRYPVDPLPDEDAEALFVERARAVAPGFEPTTGVGDICRRLDGLPLAIELAAARVALLDPDDLLTRLDRRLPLLAARSRDAPARHRTLRATIAWSYELLDPAEQGVFRRLAVFRGSFSFEAAEAICEADLDTLESLVVKSLLRRWRNARLGMLDTIREYALERLEEPTDRGRAGVEELFRRHASFFLALAETASAAADSDVRQLRAEYTNLQNALGWAVDNDPTLALRFCDALGTYWWAEGRHPEADRWGERVLTQAAALAPMSQARALFNAGSGAYLVGDFERAGERFERSLELSREAGDELGVRRGLSGLGNVARQLRNYDQSITRFEEALELSRKIGDARGIHGSLHGLGAALRDAGNRRDARERLAESIALAQESGHMLNVMGATHTLGDLELDDGDFDQAEALYSQTLEHAHRIGQQWSIAMCLAGLASAAAGLGDDERAARLWGSVEAIEQHERIHFFADERPRYERFVQPCCERNPEAVEQGRTTPLGAAVAYALVRT
jgi:predicted ATPase/class 3 adenylate cyclase/Flp pilus assembly protein TadD